MVVGAAVDAESEAALRAETGRVIEAIEERSGGSRLTSQSLRARVRRMVRHHGAETVLALVDKAPSGMGVPMLVRWCQRAAHGQELFTVVNGTGPDPLDSSLSDVVDLLVMALAGNPADDMTRRPPGELHPQMNSTTAMVVGRVACDTIRRLRFGPGMMDSNVVAGLRALHSMASIAVEARGALVGLTDDVAKAGASWPQIAAALGIGTTEAMQRYGTTGA